MTGKLTTSQQDNREAPTREKIKGWTFAGIASCTGDDTMRMMAHYDLCITWCWEYDADFVRLLDEACREAGLQMAQVSRDALADALGALEAGYLTFGAFLDRTEHEAPFAPFSGWALENGCQRINPKEFADWAEDKANIHPELNRIGLDTPRTIILPPWNEQAELAEVDLEPLGRCFVIKPSFGGGGEGVVMGATSFQEVLAHRVEYPHLRYLLQQTITPQKLDGRDAWFRIIYCDGQIYPCWWDPVTHIYSQVSGEDEERWGLMPLKEITHRIAGLCKLGFFSTEIAFDQENHWVVIDYVNDQIDMRLQSKALDGVPDELVLKVCKDLARMVKRELGNNTYHAP